MQEVNASSYNSQEDSFVLHHLKFNLTFRNVATSTAEQIYVPTLGREILRAHVEIKCLSFRVVHSSVRKTRVNVHREYVCVYVCVCRLGVGVELNWSFPLSLSATSPTGNDGSFHRHPR